MKKSTFYIALIAVVVTAAGASFLAGNAIYHYNNDDMKLSHMSWKDVYAEPDTLVDDVDLIVHARLAGTSPGRVARSSDPRDYVPFELNHFSIIETLKGRAPAGASVTVERAGGVVNGMKMIVDADGGEFHQGEDYVLFLKRQPETTFFYQVNDEGRYHVDEHGTLQRVAGSGNASAAIDGKSIAQLRSFIKERVERQTRATR